MLKVNLLRHDGKPCACVALCVLHNVHMPPCTFVRRPFEHLRREGVGAGLNLLGVGPAFFAAGESDAAVDASGSSAPSGNALSAVFFFLR